MNGGTPMVSTGGWGIYDLAAFPTIGCPAAWGLPPGYTPPSHRAWSLNQQSMQGGGTKATVSAADAFAIDSKIDDGLPTSGSVLAVSAFFNSAACNGYASTNYMALNFSPPDFNTTGSQYQYETKTSGCFAAPAGSSACFDLIMSASF